MANKETLLRLDWDEWQMLIRRIGEKPFARFSRRIVFINTKKDVYPHVTESDRKKFDALVATPEPPAPKPEPEPERP